MAKKIFVQAALSKNEHEYQSALRNFSPKLKTFISKYRDEQLFVSQRGDISFGKTTSAGAESGNNILKPIRKLEMTSGLLLFHKKE